MENIIYLIVGFGSGYLYGKVKGKVWGKWGKIRKGQITERLMG
ncbi:MAG TPA: hypothetical protein VJ046_01375 [Candidatus Paceibacterota bacterium]|nr:hypothetical protein [Candidatus Paceibacterota bacterium]